MQSSASSHTACTVTWTAEIGRCLDAERCSSLSAMCARAAAWCCCISSIFWNCCCCRFECINSIAAICNRISCTLCHSLSRESEGKTSAAHTRLNSPTKENSADCRNTHTCLSSSDFLRAAAIAVTCHHCKKHIPDMTTMRCRFGQNTFTNADTMRGRYLRLQLCPVLVTVADNPLCFLNLRA